MKSKRQPPNLKRMLPKASLKKNNTTPKVLGCNKQNCGLFFYLIEGEKILSKPGKIIKVLIDIRCDVKKRNMSDGLLWM